MDGSNYVSQDGSGKWMVVVNGQYRGTYATQAQAEQAYNSATQGSSSGGSSGSSSGVSTGTRSAIQQYDDNYVEDLRARVRSNDITIAEARRQFDAKLELDRQQLGLSREELEERKRQFDRKLYSDTALSLLSTASSLRGPADWLSYAQYTNGGKNIFQRLFGSEAVPGFGAPSGYSKAVDLSDILSALGINGFGQTSTNTTGANTQNYTTQSQNVNEGDLQSKEMPAAAYAVPGLPAAPPAYGTWPEPWRRQQQQATQAAQTSQTGTAQSSGSSPMGSNQAPLPHQINKAVWDSMSNTAKQMILAAAEKGYTPSGAWAADDYLRQIYEAAPKGNAPRQVFYNWGRPQRGGF